MPFGFSYWKTYVFRNASALAYWNALTTANGSELNGSIYGISTYNLKKAIDEFFITGNTDGWLAEMIAMYLYIGGTSATHAINAKNPGTHNLTFVGAPTHRKEGFGQLNGTTQYAQTGIIPSSHLTVNDVHLSSWNLENNNSVVHTYLGALTSATVRLQLLFSNTLTAGLFDAYNSTSGGGRVVDVTNATNRFKLGSRRASNDAEIYSNGVSNATISGSGGSQPAIEIFIGAQNSSGSPANFATLTFQFNSIGGGLTDAQQLSLYNAIADIKTTLGR
jgi:hypothetical protein